MLIQAPNDNLWVNMFDSATLHIHRSWVDRNTSTGVLTPGRTNWTISSPANTNLDGPDASNFRAIQLLSIRNAHASVSTRVKVAHDPTNDGLITATLLPGESLVLGSAGFWIHYGPNGGRVSAGKLVATQAEMEAATTTNRTVTPANQVFHPGHPKGWVKCGIDGTVLASFNITSVTDVGVGFATVVIDVDFSSANWVAQVATERPSTTMTVAELRMTNILNSGQAAGSVAMECYDRTATTALVKDPAAWHMTAQGDRA